MSVFIHKKNAEQELHEGKGFILMRNNWLFAAALGLPLVMGFNPAAYAQAPTATAAPAATTGASQFVQSLADEALNSINGKRLTNDETEARFREILRKSFDLKSIGRFVLGSYYNVATDDQRQQYQQAFENMIVDAYALRFRDYSGGSFKTGRETKQGRDTMVESQIMQGNGAPPINVTWRVRSEPEGYKIVDVAVEGVSMSATERSEFSSVIDRNGGKVQALIDAMNNHQIGAPN